MHFVQATAWGDSKPGNAGVEYSGEIPANAMSSSSQRMPLNLRQGVPVTDLATQLGHSKKSMTLDTSSHVLLGD
jgi:hypothetical protein